LGGTRQPDRVFEYVLASKSKKLGFFLSVPKEMKMKYRVLQIDKALGGKIIDPNPPVFKETAKRIEVTWSSKNKKPLQRFDVYRIEWK